jgi:type IV secretion/conjugal transfer VirB4 family ATPase
MWREDKPIPTGLDDVLNYAFLIAPGVMLLKDGALLTAWYFQGPDLDYSAPEEMERLSAQLSSAATRCGTGWMWHLDLIRRPALGYMSQGAFPHPTLALIDEEARQRYRKHGHFESLSALTMTYLPPPEVEAQFSALLYDGPQRHKPGWEAVVDAFTRTVKEIEDMLSSVLNLSQMTDEDVLTYLHLCVTGLDHPVRVPSVPVDLDTLIADQDLIGGFRPQIGEQHVRVLSLDGYPQLSEPGSQAFLHELPMSYRWSTRFIFLDRLEAEKLITKKRRHWWQKRHTFGAVMAEGAHGEESRFSNQDAVDMAQDANAAAAEAASGDVIYGLYTMTLIVMDESEERVEILRRDLQKQVQRYGFGCRNEEANALEALIGSWPGHGYQNVRRVPMHSLNLADLLPLTSVWAGLATNPNPYFPTNSPPLMMTATTGQTPFRLHLHVSDVGHTLVQGPTGAGKSMLTNFAAAQFARYPGAQVFYFDKGYSSFVFAHASGADYYDIGTNLTVAFTPLAHVDDETEREWALDWLDGVLSLQGVTVTPGQRHALWRALTLLGESTSRTMTDLVATVQDVELRNGLQHYTLGGGAGALLDAARDSLRESPFMVFEMETLLSRGIKDLIPVLLYLFHRIDQRCQAGVPTLIVIDEAWLLLARDRFGQQLETWLRTLRKKNAAVLLATQSLADLERSPYRSVIIESCPTKIFLPNAEARTEQSAALYHALGLNDRQIEMLSYATLKKHYFYSSPLGRRLFDLHAGPVARAFVGAGGREDITQVQAMIATHGTDWPYYWLIDHGCQTEAEWWARRKGNGEKEDRNETFFTTAALGNGVAQYVHE